MTALPEVQFPSTERLIRGWLVPRLAGPRVVTDLPADLASAVPLVQVTRIGGGVSVPLVLEDPRVDFDAYAATRGAADDLSRRVQALLPTMRGESTGGGVVALVVVEVGASWRPDPNPDVRRFGITASFSIRPA